MPYSRFGEIDLHEMNALFPAGISFSLGLNAPLSVGRKTFIQSYVIPPSGRDTFARINIILPVGNGIFSRNECSTPNGKSTFFRI